MKIKAAILLLSLCLVPWHTAYAGFTSTNQMVVDTQFCEQIQGVIQDYESYEVPKNGIKSYMGYKAITMKSSPQYKLQHNEAYTGDYGIRMVEERYCVAVGTHFGMSIGDKFDLVLENGTIIPCILADIKANKDTDANNIITEHDGSAAEFVVDTKALVKRCKRSGDISKACDEWDSRIEEVRVYD